VAIRLALRIPFYSVSVNVYNDDAINMLI